ncbi:MAG: type I-C CRISPR-associated protein Cas8c/Csd1, partial [Acidaminococcaceae bacterium]
MLGLEAATTGRLSICFYKKLTGSLFLENILHWHNSCYWQHNYKKGTTGEYLRFVGAPSLKDIAETAFGNKNEKVLKNTLERLLPCVIDGRNLPVDVMRAAVNKVAQPESYDNGYLWSKACTITCALVRKYRYDKFEEEWNMGLDRKNRDRSYLFGRLLGAARKLEEVALYSGDEKRITAAERFSQNFVKHPSETWKIIEGNLQVYKNKLKPLGKLYFYEKEIFEICDLFEQEDFTKKAPLTELYLL